MLPLYVLAVLACCACCAGTAAVVSNVLCLNAGNLQLEIYIRVLDHSKGACNRRAS
jgi:hypothetical protein